MTELKGDLALFWNILPRHGLNNISDLSHCFDAVKRRKVLNKTVI